MKGRILCLGLIVLCSFTGGCAPLRENELGGKDMHRVVRANDILWIDLQDALLPEIDHWRVVQVDGNGDIPLPLLGKIPVAGKTHSELEGFIKRIWNDNMCDYIVNVKVRSATESDLTL